MDVQITRTGGTFLYDAFRDQYDTNIIQDLAGVPVMAANKLLISAADICTYTAGSNANLEMLISIPVAPVAAQSKVFGFKSPATGNRGAMVFDITDDVFTAKVYNLAGTATLFSYTIPWSAAWTATETKFRISATERLVVFAIEDVIVAQYNQPQSATISAKSLSRCPIPIRVTNVNADNLLIGTLALY